MVFSLKKLLQINPICLFNVKTQPWRTNQSIYSEMYFSLAFGLSTCVLPIFLTFLCCNGIAKITRQEENILFVLTTIYPFNPLKNTCFHYCAKLIDRKVKLGARAKRSVRTYFKHTAFL